MFRRLNQTFVSFCLALLSGLLLPCLVLAGLALRFPPSNVWEELARSLPLSAILSLLTIFIWLWGPPRPDNRLEAFGRWFLALLLPSGMAFVAVALPALLVSVVDHTQLTSYQNLLIGIHVVWGLLCGAAAGGVLQYREWRESRLKSATTTSCGCSCSKF